MGLKGLHQNVFQKNNLNKCIIETLASYWPHVPEPLDEPGLLPVGAELGVGGRGGIELGHVDDAVLGQDRLGPEAADVVQARGH